MRSTHFKETREQRSFEVIEDYTELIADLLKERGSVRVCDLAKEMGISHVSVLKTLKKLRRDGFVEEDEESILLTKLGTDTAKFSKKKHNVLTLFLQKIGVPKNIAATDVEGIEHHISKETLSALEKYLDSI